MAYKVVDKKSANTSGGAIKDKIMPDKQLGETLQKSIVRKFKKEKVYSSVKDKIWVHIL